MICSDILEMPQTPAKNSPPHLFQDWGLSEQVWEIGRALAKWWLRTTAAGLQTLDGTAWRETTGAALCLAERKDEC